MAQREQVNLRQKIGQMFILGFEGAELQPDNPIFSAIQQDNIGGVILFDYNFQTKTYDKNIKNPEQLKQLTTDLQAASLGRDHDALPLLISIDYEGGKVNRLKENLGFPATLSAEKIAQQGLDVAEKYAAQMSETLKASGINLNFVPSLDVNINPDNPVIGKCGRSFSSDANVVASYARVFANAHSKNKILCAYKHFPGHGSSCVDSHLGFVDVSDTWQNSELDPYRELLADATPGDFVMTAHVVNRKLDPAGLPATLSKPILTDLLRNELNFKGVIITDDMQMKAIADEYGLEEAVVKAVNAGADMMIFGGQLEPQPLDAQMLVDIIYNNVERGVISAERIDEAYQRIVAVKKRLQ